MAAPMLSAPSTLLARLSPDAAALVVLVNVVEPVIVPPSARPFPSSARARIRLEVAALNQERYQQAQATVATGAARLDRSGWTAKGEVRVGAPLASLLKAVAEHRGDLLVLGARATSGLERALLGSVANGALNNRPLCCSHASSVQPSATRARILAAACAPSPEPRGVHAPFPARDPSAHVVDA